MSQVVLPRPGETVSLPAAVRELLRKLRGGLRRYTLLSGISIVVSVLVTAFWVTTGLDAAWFALQKLELPVGLRILILAGLVGGSGWVVTRYLLRPVFRRTTDSELALVLERRFPEFQDRLMTVVEPPPESGPNAVSRSMLQRTMQAADEVAGRVSADEVFDATPLKKQLALATFAIGSVVLLAAFQPSLLQRWWNAFVLCQDVYHVRQTQLNFTVIAQPGDRKLKFRKTPDAWIYLHPRGADFELQMTVPEGESEHGQQWQVPDRVRVDVQRFDGSRSRTYVTPTAERTFRFILTRLQETVSIEVLAGDFRTRVPLKVKAVAPPSIDTMRADCTFPEYTGLNGQRESQIPILGSEISLPIGTTLTLSATANKPLQSARITTDRFEIFGDRNATQIVPRSNYTGPTSLESPLLSDDGLRLSLPLRIALAQTADNVSTKSKTGDSKTGDSEGSTADGDIAASDDASGSEADSTDEAWLPIPSNTLLKFELHDEDDIQSSAPESLQLQGVPDRPPVVAVRAQGVGNAITRKAVIPMTGIIRDDYGLVSAEYQFLVDDETNWRTRKFLNPFRPQSEYNLEAANGPGSEFFRVQELVSEGQTLALTIVATDGCTIPAPNTARAEPMVFRIVSDEELLSLLYSRELTLRRRFEETILQLTQIQDDLEFHRSIAARADSADPGPDRATDVSALATSARLNGDSLRRQANELTAIADEFEQIRQQLINNSIPPQQLAADMQQNIIEPLRLALSGRLEAADRALSRFRVAAGGGQPTQAALQESLAEIQGLLDELRLILENVRDMAEFHEIYQEGKLIHEELLRLWAETRELQKRRAIEKLKLFE